MLSDLISSAKGVNRLWKALTDINKSVGDNAIELGNLRSELQDRLSDVLGYTDREINDLLNYINGMYGGVNGFAEDTNFLPNYPKDVAATVIGVGPGTFVNMLGEDGSSITIDSEVVVIFFKAEGSTYWKYKTVIPNIVRNEVTSEFGDSPTKVVSQKFFTEVSKGVIGGTIDIADIDTYGDASKNGLYALKKGNSSVGILLVSGDATFVYQFIFGGVGVKNGVLTEDERGGTVFRVKNISSLTSDISIGSWGPWRLPQEDFMQVISEDDYEVLKASGSLVEDRFYFLYAEE